MIMFLEKTKSDDEICEIYKKIRIWLQESGYTTEQSERVSEAPVIIWQLQNELRSGMEKLKKTLKQYGILRNDNELHDYIVHKFIEINKEYPLIDEL